MTIFITGTAGFIGYHLAELLLTQGHAVHGYDGMTDYYDVRLKHARHDRLRRHPGFTATEALLEDDATLQAAIDAAQPNAIVHLAAQAGVRYSIDNPRAYIDANIIGTFNVMEGARRHKVRHLLMASTSSVYGANTDMPFTETQKCDTPMSFYAATKKATEAMAHSHAHLFGLPTTMFRFFTVYGPWGRPDMALFKFTKAILAGQPIDIYNHGDMWRDFTYVEDLVRAIALLIDCPPPAPSLRGGEADAAIQSGASTATAAPMTAAALDRHAPAGLAMTASTPSSLRGAAGDAAIQPSASTPAATDSLSPVAPWRVVNIGNSDKVRLLDYVEAIEDCLGKKASRHYMDMQPGDVPATWADASLLQRLTGYRPQTDFKEGVRRFVQWYREFYG